MSIPISATEELVAAAEVVVKGASATEPTPLGVTYLKEALDVWHHDQALPEAAKADRPPPVVQRIQVMPPDPDVLDRAADILEERMDETKGILRRATAKTLVRALPEIARNIRREKNAQ